MKKILTIVLIFCSVWVSGQISPAAIIRIQNDATVFGEPIPKGYILYDANTKKYWGVVLAQAGTRKLSNCIVTTDIKELTNDVDIRVQALSGTTVSWDCTLGINATLTLSGTTTVTLSNVPVGASGNIKVTNPVGAANILNFALSGKTVLISAAVYVSSGRVATSGASKTDMYSWYYDGTNLIINGSLIYL